MSYASINRCANDQAFQGRVTACAAQEGEPDPGAAMYRVIWPVSTAFDIEAAYASALAAENPNPGGDETVVTDGMILSSVQAALSAPPAGDPTPDTTWTRPQILAWLAEHGANVTQAATLSHAELLDLVADLLDTP